MSLNKNIEAKGSGFLRVNYWTYYMIHPLDFTRRVAIVTTAMLNFPNV